MNEIIEMIYANNNNNSIIQPQFSTLLLIFLPHSFTDICKTV